MTRGGRPKVAVLAVDGGNSKSDVALLDRAGRVLGAARGGGSSHFHHGVEGGMDILAAILAGALADAGLPPSLADPDADPTAGPLAEVGMFCLAGDDLPVDDRVLAAAIDRRAWARRPCLRNDAFAMLRAGTDRDWGVVVVCGAGINCAGTAPDGRTVRFPAIGDISGDWGGGYDVGMAALAAAVRARDGRGPRTVLETGVPAHFGLSRPAAVTEAIYAGRIPQYRVVELPPVVFAAAAAGDAVAGDIVDRLAAEVATMALAAIRRLRLARTDVEVVVGGGLFRAGSVRLADGVTARLTAAAPRARLRPLTATPVSGAALLGLAELPGARYSPAAVRAALAEARLAGRRRGRRRSA